MTSISISQTICNRRHFYSSKLTSYQEWSSKRCEMNETPLKYIRKMLLQMLKELAIPTTSSNSILNCLYNQGYDATNLVNRICDKKEDIFDVLSKDSIIRLKSIEASIYALDCCKISIVSLNNTQLTGLCVFVQFILSGGRSECEGFGSSPDLVEKWKKQSRTRKIQEQQKLLAENKKRMEEATKRSAELLTLEEEINDIKLEPEEIVESWEDL